MQKKATITEDILNLFFGPIVFIYPSLIVVTKQLGRSWFRLIPRFFALLKFYKRSGVEELYRMNEAVLTI